MKQIKGPLNGIKVLDFSTLLPGPYATMILADMGAEVVRIESPTRPDLLREMAPKFDERSYAHLTINRNKRSLALDLKHKESIAIVKKLVAEYDIVVEQFRPGVMNRLGLDFESLKLTNKKIIYCSITGYGQTGPLKDRAGHDINYLALSGLASYSGRSETGPVLSATQIADIAGGSHHAVMAIQAAIIQRQLSGEGQYLDISMSDCALALNTVYGASALASEQNPDYGAEILNGGIFYDYYLTKDKRYISVGGLEPQFVAGFFAALGHPEWMVRALDEKGQQQDLKTDIAAVISTQTLNEWQQVFDPLDVCVEPVLTVNEAAGIDHFNERCMISNVKLSQHETIKQIASPLKFLAADIVINPGAKLGEHSVEILKEVGFDSDEIERLTRRNIIV